MGADLDLDDVAATSEKAHHQLKELRAALEWYAEMAKQMQRATLHGDSQYMLGRMKELAMDGGKRAREAMTPNELRQPAEAGEENRDG